MLLKKKKKKKKKSVNKLNFDLKYSCIILNLHNWYLHLFIFLDEASSIIVIDFYWYYLSSFKILVYTQLYGFK